MDRQYLMPRSRPKLLVAIVAGAIILGSGGYGIYQTTTTPGGNASTDAGSRLAYSDTQAGYSLMYPKDWSKTTTQNGNGQLVLSSPDYTESQYRQIPLTGARIIVTATPTTATSAADVLVANANYAASAGSIRQVPVAGLNGRSFVISGGITGDRRTIVVAGGRQYEVKLVTPAGVVQPDTATASSYESVVKSLKIK